MIRNHFITAWRNLFRNKSYTLINIIGLAVGIASCLLIFLVIHFETSFDNFHKKKDHIYRIVTAEKTAQGINYLAGVPMPTAGALRIDYPQLIVASIFRTESQISISGNSAQTSKKFEENNVYFVEPEFFKVFDFDWLSGDKKTALNEPNAVVLTQSIAEKYFGNWKDAIGKTIQYENANGLKVTGVLKNMPVNTDMDLQVVASYATLKYTHFKNALNDAGGIIGSHYCFVVLPGNMSVNRFNNDLVVFVKKHKTCRSCK